MPAIKLNDKYLRNLKAKEKRIYVYDSLITGLGVRITPAGVKTFFISFYSVEKGYNKRFTLGKFPALGIADARNRAAALLADAKRGIDPGEQKRKREQKRREAVTFKVLAKSFIADYLPKLKPSTQGVYKSHISTHIVPKLGRKELKDFTRQDARRFLKTYAEAGQAVHGNRIHATLSKMLNYAVDEGHIQGNPVLGLAKLSNEQSRERAYNRDEIKALWEAFEAEAANVAPLLKMLMLTGQRRGETARMKWADVNPQKGVWIIPRSETKNKQEHTVPLTPMAMDLLAELKPLTGEQPYVFNSLHKEATHVNSFSKLTIRIQKRSGVSDFRIHDIRRTVATQLAEDGTPQQVLKKILNHSAGARQDVTAIYNRYDYLEEKKTALLNWQRILSGIIAGEDAECNVRTLKSG